MLLPHEQLYKVLALNLTVFKTKYARELQQVIESLDEYDIYKENLIDWDRKFELEKAREQFLFPKKR
jgi:hypothetical protein